MPSPSKFLLFSAAFSVTSALPWTGPKPTATYDPANWTPKPTEGSIPEHALLGRSWFFPASTCGWIGGDYSSVVTCPPSSSCVWDTSRSFVGCCPSNSPCSTGVYTGCVDAKSGKQTVVDPAVTTCSGTSICYLNSFPQGFHQYGCGLSNTAATVSTNFAGEPASYHLQIITTSLNIPAASTIAGAVNSPAVITSGSSMTKSGIPTAVAEHSYRTSTGSIVGGVVGGIAGVILLIVLGVYILRRRREYYRRRPGRNKSRSGKSSSSKSISTIKQASRAVFHRISNGALSPKPPSRPEMRIIKAPTFPPPPESHKNPPAPRYFTENQSPARSPWSPIAHIPPRFSPKRLSPFTYVPYVPRPNTPRPLSPIVSPTAYEPLRYSPKTMSPIAFTPLQESQREGQLIPLTPAIQTTEMSPIAFLPNDCENNAVATEARQISPVAFTSRTRAQSPTDARNMARELTPSPSQQSLLQNIGAAREMITPSPAGSQQPLLQSQKENTPRELITPSPTVHTPLEPIELPAPLPSKSKSPAKSKHKKTPSASSRPVTYTTIPPLQASPPRQTKRKPVSKAVENIRPSTPPRDSNQHSHIAHQLTGSPSQSLALKPKTSKQSLAPQSSRTELKPTIATSSAIGSGAALLAARAVSPEEKEEIAKKFRIKQSSPKNISPSEFEQAIVQKGGRKGSVEKIDRILGFVTGVKSKGTKEKTVQIKRPRRRVSSEYVDMLVPESPSSDYGEEDGDVSKVGNRQKGKGKGKEKEGEKEKETEKEREKEKKETASICSANILDFRSEGMGTLPFTMEFAEMYEYNDDDAYYPDHHQQEVAEDERLRKEKEKGVKWRDEVASDGNIAELSETPPRLDTPTGYGYGLGVAGAGAEQADDWSRGFGDWNLIDRGGHRGDSVLPSRRSGQVWFGNKGEEGGWL